MWAAVSRLSLRARLLLAVCAISLVALVVSDVVVYGALASYMDGQVDTSLEVSHRTVEAMADNPGAAMSGGTIFVPPGPPQGGPPPSSGPGGSGPPSRRPFDGTGSSAFCAVGRESAPGMFIEVRNDAGDVVTGVAGKEECPAFEPGSAEYTPAVPKVLTGFTAGPGTDEPTKYFTAASTTAGGPAFRVRASKLANGDLLFLAVPISNVTSTLSQLVILEVTVTAGALLGALVLGLWLVKVGLRPLGDIERTAKAIAGGDLVHRVPNANPHTEVGHLATAFNVMLARMEVLVNDLRSSESRLRRFVGDASHELRTPVAAVSAYAQLFKRGAAARPGDLERAMEGIERESARMGRLVEDLLTLARLDEHRQLEMGPIELVDLVIEACETARMLGPAWLLTFQAGDAVEVVGDRGALRQVVDNLLANVRAHTPEGTQATVTVGRSGSNAFIEVADNGPGITEEQANVIFERFFRGDSSRARTTGGAGLGLAIVAAIVDAHGGSVSASPGQRGGAVFRAVLPAIAPDKPAFVADERTAATGMNVAPHFPSGRVIK
ncbi:MAG TPA: HAMP domain-containing sensor histidine kinase [Acidimicrobiales bacterium]|nr:HAMP domain-containing sensor histidine kinase [Acidimicrobiales bacterium]